jgi:hypothetical protein
VSPGIPHTTGCINNKFPFSLYAYAVLREKWNPFSKICGFKIGNKYGGQSPKE